jgi:hypothetical protein
MRPDKAFFGLFLVFSSATEPTFAQDMTGSEPTFGAKVTSIPDLSAYTRTKSPFSSACFG